MKTVYKYPLNIARQQSFNAPGIKPLWVATQFEQPYLWAQVDTNQAAMTVVVDVYGTGEPLDPHPGEYLGTFQQFGGQFIGHVYVRSNEAA